MRDHTAAIAGEQFRARLWRNNATRLSTMLTAEDDPKSGDCLCGDPIPCGPALDRQTAGGGAASTLLLRETAMWFSIWPHQGNCPDIRDCSLIEARDDFGFGIRTSSRENRFAAPRRRRDADHLLRPVVARALKESEVVWIDCNEGRVG